LLASTTYKPWTLSCERKHRHPVTSGDADRDRPVAQAWRGSGDRAC